MSGDDHRDALFHYVLGNLTASEKSRIEALLADDESLRAELAEVRATVDLLAFASTTEPPADLRATVLDAAARQRDAELEYAFASQETRQETRAEDADMDPALAATVDQLAYATVTEPPADLRQQILLAAAEGKTGKKRAKAASTRRVSMPGLVAVAASLIAVVLGWQVNRLQNQLTVEREIATLMQEPNTVHRFALADGTAARGAHGRVALDMDAQKGAIVAHDMPPTSGDEVYRLWARVGDQDVYCGEFSTSADGDVLAVFKVPTDSYTAPLESLFVTKARRGAPKAPQGPRYLISA